MIAAISFTMFVSAATICPGGVLVRDVVEETFATTFFRFFGKVLFVVIRCDFCDFRCLDLLAIVCQSIFEADASAVFLWVV